MSRQGTIRRYTLIIEKINRKQFPTLIEIREYLYDYGFEISPRTVERDIEAIRNEFGFEITYDHSKRGYFVDEENTLNIGSFLRFLEIVNTAELLTESLKESKNSLSYISFDEGGGLKGIEYLKPILRATKEKRHISFSHFNFHTEKTKEFEMQPYLLKEYQNRWYVVGYVPSIKDVRTFGIERISNLKVLETRFKPDPKINPQAFFNMAIGVVYSLDKIQTVVLSFTPKQGHYVKSLPMHSTQQILIDNDEECRISLDIVPNYELKQKILMHNSKVKVLEPKWLAEDIKNLLQESLKNY